MSKSKIRNPQSQMCGLAEKRASRAVPESNTEEEEVMSKENAGAEPREKTAVAFPLTVAAKGTRNPRWYGCVARMRQQAAERRQSLAVARKPTVTGQQSSSRVAGGDLTVGFNPR
ncbi:MAG: hypothetical protein IPJ30_03460 [Acidobacteria bacterium]|nr:hypothetical protein [Acidobacteriota bacterium]